MSSLTGLKAALSRWQLVSCAVRFLDADCPAGSAGSVARRDGRVAHPTQAEWDFQGGNIIRPGPPTQSKAGQFHFHDSIVLTALCFRMRLNYGCR